VIRYDVGWVDPDVRDWTVGVRNEQVEHTSLTVCWSCNVLDQIECGQEIEQRCGIVGWIFNMHTEVAADDDWTSVCNQHLSPVRRTAQWALGMHQHLSSGD